MSPRDNLEISTWLDPILFRTLNPGGLFRYIVSEFGRRLYTVRTDFADSADEL